MDDGDGKVDAEDFWSAERQEILIEALKGLQDLNGFGASRLRKALLSHHPERSVSKDPGFPSLPTFERILKSDPTGEPTRWHTKHFGFVLRAFASYAEAFSIDQERRLGIDVLSQQYDAYSPSISSAPESDSSLVAFINPESGDVAQKLFLRDEDRERSCFYTYRLDRDPKKVVKSHLVLKAPASAGGSCTFVNQVIVKKGKSRLTEGVVWITKTTASFIGGVNSGNAAVFISFERPLGCSDEYFGQVLTFDDNHKPLAARVAMIRTDCVDWQSGGIGVHDIEDLATEIASFKTWLRRIPYGLPGHTEDA